MTPLEAYDHVLAQMEKMIDLMQQNRATMDIASPKIRAECEVLEQGMLETMKGLEAIANKILEGGAK